MLRQMHQSPIPTLTKTFKIKLTLHLNHQTPSSPPYLRTSQRQLMLLPKFCRKDAIPKCEAKMYLPGPENCSTKERRCQLRNTTTRSSIKWMPKSTALRSKTTRIGLKKMFKAWKKPTESAIPEKFLQSSTISRQRSDPPQETSPQTKTIICSNHQKMLPRPGSTSLRINLPKPPQKSLENGPRSPRGDFHLQTSVERSLTKLSRNSQTGKQSAPTASLPRQSNTVQLISSGKMPTLDFTFTLDLYQVYT